MRLKFGPCAVTVLLFGSLLLPGSALAQVNDVYIAQTAQGNNTGADCADALVYTYFNTSGNWTSGTPSGTKIGPGTTVHLCGTFTGAAGATSFLTFQGGGNSSAPVTLHWENGAVLTSPGWNGQVVNLSSYSYIVIDGGTNGQITTTLNGTSGATCPGGTCAYQYSSGQAVYAQAGGSNITVKNLTVGPMYDRYCPSGKQADCGDENGQGTTGISFENGSNILVTNNTVWGCWACITYGTSSNTSNLTISGNTVYNSNHSIQFTNGTAGATQTGIYLYGNTIHDGYNWADTANDNHVDGFIITMSTSTGVDNDIWVYDNYIYGNWGNGVNAFVFLTCSVDAGCPSPQIFNNVIEDDTPFTHSGNGLLSINGSSPTIANNTLNGGSGNTTGAILWRGSNAIIENNIVISSGQVYTYEASNYGTVDYNDYYNDTKWNNESYANWKASCSCDSHSITSNPNFSITEGTVASYEPPSGSPVIGAGTNLTSLSISPLDLDFAGNQRPSSGAWDIGAYQATLQPPQPPTNLQATPH